MSDHDRDALRFVADFLFAMFSVGLFWCAVALICVAVLGSLPHLLFAFAFVVIAGAMGIGSVLAFVASRKPWR